MINFLKYKYVCAVFSCMIFALSIGAYFYRGGFSYSVDFTGGTQALLRFSKKIEPDAIKNILTAEGYKGIDTREFSKNEILVRVQEFSSDLTGIGEKIKIALQKAFPDNTIEIMQTDSVGSGVGATLRWDSMKAILIALILMLLYIAIRFKFAFAVGALVALFHDAFVILAFFLITNKEISVDVIGAILAVLGYSVNDTIIIFNQIRENLKKMKGAPVEEVVNKSINQTLRRTILTSSATALVVLSMFIFGGEALRNLSTALLLGIVFGTYSSIYIASPVMLLLYKGEK